MPFEIDEMDVPMTEGMVIHGVPISDKGGGGSSDRGWLDGRNVLDGDKGGKVQVTKIVA